MAGRPTFGDIRVNEKDQLLSSIRYKAPHRVFTSWFYLALGVVT